MLVQTRLRNALFSLLQEELQYTSSRSSQKCDVESPSDSEVAIKKSGLLDLSNEVHLLSGRIGKVILHHYKTYRQLYNNY
jgi:putative ubiquitin-RnfH superfamily antitoxin RatB of RatAB toxin-antitoxin module